ncbi:gamma-aminobutyric acid receptor subunit pi-like [Palaemon carinicauda]|uniref:gamma-aminobutyric acid receptor subunit pi-like n=1 Tax=Palaemon carinicauda TaxID=392227 RepID=UPI0035B655C8
MTNETKSVIFSTTPSTARAEKQQSESCLCGSENTPGRPSNPSLQKVVPPGYDKYVLPKNANDTNNYCIHVDTILNNVKTSQHIELTIEWFIRLYWRDPGLIWPVHLPNETWYNISPDIVNYVWLPTTYIDHVKEVTKPSLLIQPESFRMLSDGLIRYSMSLTTRVSCPMDFSAYPFDTQVCYFKMESYQFTAKEVTYEWQNPIIERTNQIHLGQFDFDFYSVNQQNTTHQGRKFPTVMVEVLLNRRISYHLMNTFLPSGLFVMVSWLTFLVPVHMVPGRMVLTITTLLTMVSMFASVRQESPKVSYAKAVDQWMIMCIIFVFMVLLEFTVALYVFEKATKAKEKAKAQEEKSTIKVKAKVAPTTVDTTGNSFYTDLAQRTSSGRLIDGDGTSGETAPSISSTLTPTKIVWKDAKSKERPKDPLRDHKYWTTWLDRLESYSPVVFFISFAICNICYWAYWMKRRVKGYNCQQFSLTGKGYNCQQLLPTAKGYNCQQLSPTVKGSNCQQITSAVKGYNCQQFSSTIKGYKIKQLSLTVKGSNCQQFSSTVKGYNCQQLSLTVTRYNFKGYNCQQLSLTVKGYNCQQLSLTVKGYKCQQLSLTLKDIISNYL